MGGREPDARLRAAASVLVTLFIYCLRTKPFRNARTGLEMDRTGNGPDSVHVLVDGVMLRVHDDAVVAGHGRSGRLDRAARDGRKRLVRDGVLVIVAAARHKYAVGGWGVTAAAGLVRGQHPVALVRAGTA